jgi:fatty acyl-CoA reductase
MAEHILTMSNTSKIPFLIVRPSIIGAALEEPSPGWTDSIALEGGIFLIAGLGILKELPCDPSAVAD